MQMFCCFVNLTKEEVETFYKKGPEDQYESVGIQFLSLDKVVELIVLD